MLQLSPGTHVVVDETALRPGTMSGNGVPNIQALQRLILDQMQDYDYSFHRLAMPTDLPVLVLSEGASILQTDCQVPLHMTRPFVLNAIGQPHVQDAALRLRTVLAIARVLPHHVSEALSARLSDDFVQRRACLTAEGKPGITPEDFLYRLGISRLVAVAHGDAELKWEHWVKTNEMEEQRRARLAALPGRRSQAATAG